MTYALWIAQGVLAMIFLYAGLLKLVQPIEGLTGMMAWVNEAPPLLVRFIGFVEVLGVLGLTLPAITRIRPGLVPLAAAGLTLIMLLAIGLHLVRGEGAMTLEPLAFAALGAFVAYGRWRVLPHHRRAR